MRKAGNTTKQNGYLSIDVERFAGVKRSTIESWIERGYISPSIQVASGHGSRNIWSMNDIRKIIIFNGLVKIGFARRLSARLIKEV